MSKSSASKKVAPVVALVPSPAAEVAPPEVTSKSLYEKSINLPEYMPPIEAAAVEERISVEVIDKGEQRVEEERGSKAPPPDPKRVITNATVTKPSIVTPIEVQSHVLSDFLGALARVAPVGDGAAGAARISFQSSTSRLVVEVTDRSIWAMAAIKAYGGKTNWACLTPIRRTQNILKRLVDQYAMVDLGMSPDQVHIGPYSIPFGGLINEFPPRPELKIDELRFAMPALYVSQIRERVLPAVSKDATRGHLQGVHIDFRSQMAVATDGHRMHMQHLPELHVELREALRAPAPVTIPPKAFEYLDLVVNREWVTGHVHPELLMVAGEDFGLLAVPVEGKYPPYESILRNESGYWLVDKQALLNIIGDVRAIKSLSAIKLSVDNIDERITVAGELADGSSVRRTVSARQSGGPASMTIGVNPEYLRDAITAVPGGLVRIDLPPAGTDSSIIIHGEDNSFTAVVMPCRI